MRELHDLGLSYEEAAHGMQTAVLHEQNLYEHTAAKRSPPPEPHEHPNGSKHLRVGLNASKSDHAAIADLLIAKGIITEAEYLEALRLRMNDELARYQEPGCFFR
jgi:hypothetical protein